MTLQWLSKVQNSYSMPYIPPVLMLTFLFDPTTFLKIHLPIALEK